MDNSSGNNTKTAAKKALLIFIVFAAAFVFVFSDILSYANKYVEDICYHNAGSADSNIRIIRIDDKSMNALGDFSDWDRGVYADLVETLCGDENYRPAVIGFDVLFTGDGDDEQSQRFAQACEKAGNVVCAFSYVFTKELVTDSSGQLMVDHLSVQDKIEPYPALEQAVDVGFANALMDNDDGVIRSSFLWYDENGERVPSFSAAIYEKLCGSAPQQDKGIFPFRYSAGVSEYENVSLIDVLDGTIPPQVFSGCTVLVGAYAAGMMDAYYVPVDRGQQMYGVEIHANVIQALLENKSLTEIPKMIDSVAAAVIAALMFAVCSRLSVVRAGIVCALTAAVRFSAGFLLFNFGYSGSVLEIPVLALVCAIWFTAVHYYSARAARYKIEKAFNKYVAPQVVKEIAANGSYELKLGGENRDVAVLFVDIRGFTPLSESLEPEQVVDILNSYLALVTNCIFKHGGTLDKFIGDAAMAVFNAPFDTDDYVFKAVQTALDIVKGGEQIEQQFSERYGKHVGFGVGVNCGRAVVGNIGCDFRMDYTAIGDTVNTAARLEANAPRGEVYISEEVLERIKDRVDVEKVGEIPLKGKSKSVMVYSLKGLNEKGQNI